MWMQFEHFGIISYPPPSSLAVTLGKGLVDVEAV
jgi:hypothetical protein